MSFYRRKQTGLHSSHSSHELRGGRYLYTIRRTAALAAAFAVTLAFLFPAFPAKAASSEEETFFILTQEFGYGGAAACGIMANIRVESNYYPGAYNGSGAYGICQWMGGRQSHLHSWCSSNGYDSDSLRGQLAFLDYEMRSNYTGVYNYLMSVEDSADGAYNAAYEMCYYYEAPANRSGQGSSRGSYAANTLWPRYEIYTRDIWLDTDKGRMYHYKDGSYHTGWLELDDEIYYLDEDGILRIGMFTVDGKTYMTDEDGARVTGWQTVGDGTYYFSPEDGSMQTGWIEVDGQQYFLDSNGKLERVNTFTDKTGVSEEEIEEKAKEQNGGTDENVNAPSADPLPLPDEINDAVEDIENAGEDSKDAAAVVASPGEDTAVDPDDYGAGETPEDGTMDTSDLTAGEETEEPVTMDSSDLTAGEETEEPVTMEVPEEDQGTEEEPVTSEDN